MLLASTTDSQAKKKRDPVQPPAQAATRRAGDGVQPIALRSFQAAAAQAAVVFHMPDGRFDGLSPLHPHPLPSGQPFGLAKVQDLNPIDLAAAVIQVQMATFGLWPIRIESPRVS